MDLITAGPPRVLRAASLAYGCARTGIHRCAALDSTRSCKMASLSEAQELLSEEQKAARDADLDARLEKLKMEVNQ